MNKEMLKEKLNTVRKQWPELAKADEQANGGGFDIDLMSAHMYAQRDGLSFEEYIIKVLREERIRRQELDSVIRDRSLLDEIFLQVKAAKTDFLTFVATKYGDGDIRKINPDFLVKVIRYLEEGKGELSNLL